MLYRQMRYFCLYSCIIHGCLEIWRICFMKLRRFISITVTIAMLFGVLPMLNITTALAKTVAEPRYGDEFFDDNGFESATVGAYQHNNWRIYYNLDVAYAEIVSAGDYPDYVIDNKAYRFCQEITTGFGRGIYYNKSVEAGTEYEFSGMFTTDSDTPAEVSVFYAGGPTLAKETLTKGEWKNVVFRFKVPEGTGASNMRLSTNLMSNRKASDFG